MVWKEAVVTCLLGETEKNCDNLGMSGVSAEIPIWALTEYVSRNVIGMQSVSVTDLLHFT
jgi:hypothetical protein